MENYMDYLRGNMFNCNMGNMPSTNMDYPMMNEYEYSNHGKYMEPINMNFTYLHKMVMEEVNIHIKKIMISNMGQMPKAISKDMYKKELNDMLANIMKNEDEIKKQIAGKNELENEGETDRIFCPYCQGFMGNMLGFVFLNSLLTRGCLFCY